MRGRKMAMRLGIAMAIGTALLAGPAAVTPAKADCVYLTAYVTRAGATPIYAHNGCVTGTPWNYAVTADPRYTGTGHPTGTPNGFFVDVRVPVP